MNTFPANAIPQFSGPPHMAGFPPGVGVPGMPGVPGVPGLPGGPMPPGMQQQMGAPGLPMMADPQHLAMMQQQQQSFLAQQQQQQLSALSHQQLLMRGSPSGTMQHASKKKKHSARATPQAQMLPRHMSALAPPHGQEHYIKNAMAPPGQVGAPGMPMEQMEPWADALDELDPRELAMGRFRARHEIMAEVFGPERVQDIPGATDAWEGLGLNGETLEAKVLALESSNAELEAKFESELEAFRKRLEEADGPIAQTA